MQSRTGALNTRLAVTESIMPGVVSLPHGFAGPNANALTDELFVEPVVGTSVLNGVAVTVRLASVP